jgi:hypothetical protein
LGAGAFVVLGESVEQLADVDAESFGEFRLHGQAGLALAPLDPSDVGDRQAGV